MNSACDINDLITHIKNSDSADEIRKLNADLIKATEPIIQREIKLHKGFFDRMAYDEDDFAQEVNLSIISKINTFDARKASYITWGTKVADNILMKRLRKDTKLEKVTIYRENEEGEEICILDTAATVNGPMEHYRYNAGREELYEKIDGLQENYRIVINDILRDADVEETAKTLNCKPANVYVIRNRAIAALRKTVNPALVEDMDYDLVA